MTSEEVLIAVGIILLLALTFLQVLVAAYNLLSYRVSDSTPACVRFKGGFRCDYGRCKAEKCVFGD